MIRYTVKITFTQLHAEGNSKNKKTKDEIAVGMQSMNRPTNKMLGMDTLLTKTSGELVIEDLSCEMYSLESNCLQENVPFGAKVQLQAFLHAASLRKMQILYQEKWLTRISVNSALDAFGFGLAKFSEILDQLPTKKSIVILKVILETNPEYPDKSLHIQQLLDKILPLDDSLTILSKNFIKSSGHIDLDTATLERVFTYHSKLLDSCCEVLNKQLEKDLAKSWMVKACSESLQLYDAVYGRLKPKNPANLQKFVQSVCRYGQILPYPSHEQSCVILCMIPSELIVLPLKESHYSKLIDELLRLWYTHPESVVKMIDHFPFIIQCLSERCDNNINAKKLCIHLVSSHLLNT